MFYCHTFIYVITFLLGMVPPLPQINGYTHWSVSPNGMIEPITTSFFQLRQPWHLLKLLQQEDNYDLIQTVDWRLSRVSDNLKLNQQYQKNVQNIYVDENSACAKSTKHMGEFDLHSTHILTLEAKGIQSQDFLDEELQKSTLTSKLELKEPLCDAYFNRTFSLCCFEHLESIRNRSKFHGVPEISLYKVALPQHLTPSEFGHLVALALKRDHGTSAKNWILYNMAAFYWRVKGSAKNAIECLRAALHTSPNEYLDVALVSLSNVLHLIKSTSNDAVILMKNAVLISPHFSSHHIILGNVFASLGQFNDSLYHFQLAAQLYRPDKDRTKLKDIEERIFAARCSHELSVAISAQQVNLNTQVKELDSFQQKTEHYHMAKTSLELERIDNATQMKRQKIYEAYIDKEENEIEYLKRCLVFDPFIKQMVPCYHTERNVVGLLHINVTDASLEHLDQEMDFFNPIYKRLYNPLFPQERKTVYVVNETDCKTMKCFNLDKNYDYQGFMSINLSPRNKGFELFQILTKSQGLGMKEEHSLPWHPPYCMLYADRNDLPSVDVVDKLTSMRQMNSGKINDADYPRAIDNILVAELLKLVNNSDVRLEDIGQRIVTAITKRLTPSWIILNIAGLYWRVVGNFLRAIECQRLSVKLSPQHYRDVAMINLAAILWHLNQTEDALKLTKSALQIDYSEPESHLLAAGLYMKLGNYQLAFQHLKIAIKQEPHIELAKLAMTAVKCRLCFEQKSKSNVKVNVVESNELETVSRLFVKYNMCASLTECKNIISDNWQQLPHIKIIIKGQPFSHADIESFSGAASESIHHDKSAVSQIMYGFLWNTNFSNNFVMEQECVVTNDSARSAGCHLSDDIYEGSNNAIKFLMELQTLMKEFPQKPSKPNKPDVNIKKQTCHNDRSAQSVDLDGSQSSSKYTSVKLHDDIIKLISSRVVLSPLAPEDCEYVAPFDFKTYTPLYVSLNTMHINVATILDSFVPSYSFSFSHQPYCSPKGDNNFLLNILVKHKVDFENNRHSKVPEYNLHASFLKTFDDKYTLDEIGKRLYTGLNQNASDWRVATIIVNYWRVYGDANEAFKCLQVAMETSPDYHLKVILVNAANILYRVDKLEAALEVSYKALKCPDGHKWIVIPFLVANIFATMEQWQKATLFYEFCLSIKDHFEEAIYRIKSIQCQQIVLKNLEQH